MSSRRNKLLKRLMANTTGETEEKLMKLTIERICADMCEHYAKFYTFEGPGVMVFKPGAEEKDSMFYLSVDALITALEDNKDQESISEVSQSRSNEELAVDIFVLVMDECQLVFVLNKEQ